MVILYEHLYKQVELVLRSKVEECHYHRYTEIYEDDIWYYCTEKVWRKEDIASLPIHRVVHTILRLTPSEILAYEQSKQAKKAEVEKQPPLIIHGVHINDEELEMLLAPLSNKSSE